MVRLGVDAERCRRPRIDVARVDTRELGGTGRPAPAGGLADAVGRQAGRRRPSQEALMKPFLLLLTVLAAVAVAAGRGGAAGAGAPPNRCPEEPPFDLPGPEICTFSFSEHRELPAGTRCEFDVTIDIEWTGRFTSSPTCRAPSPTWFPWARRPATVTRWCGRALRGDGESRDRFHRPRSVREVQTSRWTDGHHVRGI